MKKVLIVLLTTTILFAGCGKAVEPPSTKSGEVVQEFIESFSNGDLDACLNLVSDDILFSQDPPGYRTQGKNLFEYVLSTLIAWHSRYHVTSPFEIKGNLVTVSSRIISDDLDISGMEYISVVEEFQIADGKIKSLLSMPSAEDLERLDELRAGVIGVQFRYVAQGIEVVQIFTGSLAGEAGVEVGDIIIAVEGYAINSEEMREGEIQLRIAGPVGSLVRLTLLRAGMETTFDVEVKRISMEELISQ